MNFKQLPNGMCEGFALLKKCDVKKTKNGAAYLDLVLGDKSDELPAKLWDYTDNGLFAPDMVVKVRGTVEQYNGRDQFLRSARQRTATTTTCPIWCPPVRWAAPRSMIC